MDVAADAPAVVSFGWDGGRLGTVVVERSASISVPISGLRGRRTFWTRSVSGGTARPVATKWRTGR
jgi:hypothetical protein